MGSYYRDLRTLALHAVLTEPHEYHLRQIFRWYSKTFHVPLLDVPYLNQEHILQAYYECQYEEMQPEQLEIERQELLKTDEDKLRDSLSTSKQNADDAKFEAEVNALAEKQNKKEKEKPISPVVTPKAENSTLDKMPVPKPGSKLPQNITMRFVSEEEFEKGLDASSFEEKDHHNLKVNTYDDDLLGK